MRIAHLSDTHLGFRAYAQTTASGFNQREVDVMSSFREALQQIHARDPDLVIHAGDMFHVVRPSNATIVKAFRELSAFQEKRKGKPFVLIGGNHDTPRTADSGNLLTLFGDIPGVRLVASGMESLDYPELDLEILAVPSRSLDSGEQEAYVPSLGRKNKILTLHGMAREAVSYGAQFELAQTRMSEWTYVALGDYHIHQAYAPHACYAGSTDFTSTNIWEEVSRPKGWVWFDTGVGQLEHVPVHPRSVLDLPVIDAADLTPEQIEEAMRAQAVWEPEAQPIVRQRIHNVTPGLRGKISVSLVREIASRSLAYQLVTTPPAKSVSSGVGGGANGTSPQGLDQVWEEHVRAATLPASIKAEDLVACGWELMREVAESETAPITA